MVVPECLGWRNDSVLKVVVDGVDPSGQLFISSVERILEVRRCTGKILHKSAEGVEGCEDLLVLFLEVEHLPLGSQ